MRVVFTFESGARSGEQVAVTGNNVIRLGRHPACDVACDAHRDLTVSGRHAEVRVEPDGLYLYDVGSANGTFIGEARVSRHRLRPGEQVRLGLGGPEVTIGFVDYDVPPTVRGVPAVPSASPAPELAGVVLQPTMPPPGAFAAGPIPAGDDDASSGRGGEGC